jgi:hypothetical protein
MVRAGDGALVEGGSGTDSDSGFCGRETEGCGEEVPPFVAATTDPLRAGRRGPWAGSLGCSGAEEVGGSLGSCWWP